MGLGHINLREMYNHKRTSSIISPISVNWTQLGKPHTLPSELTSTTL